MTGNASPRLRWVAETLAVKPDDRLLEIGCGQGVAVSLVCEKLAGGKVVAIDRSAKMVEMATKRNAECIAAGNAEIVTGAFPDVDLGDEQFTKIFASHINVFWRQPDRELAAVRSLLVPAGSFYLFSQPLDRAKIEESVNRALVNLECAGFIEVKTVSEDIDGGPIICVAARSA
jgi:cyclopropane fatty-acyl-phospholipid synthase-like methyltransferase